MESPRWKIARLAWQYCASLALLSLIALALGGNITVTTSHQPASDVPSCPRPTS